MNKIQCRMRREWVAATPEELVRQSLLDHMIDRLGFPSSQIALEKALKQMPHLKLEERKIPDRRADIICFAKGIHPSHALYPLLIVECKAVELNARVINQVLGYNHFLQAYFVTIANQSKIRTGWYDPATKTYQFIDRLPSFKELISQFERVS